MFLCFIWVFYSISLYVEANPLKNPLPVPVMTDKTDGQPLSAVHIATGILRNGRLKFMLTYCIGDSLKKKCTHLSFHVL